MDHVEKTLSLRRYRREYSDAALGNCRRRSAAGSLPSSGAAVLRPYTSGDGRSYFSVLDW